MKIRRLLAWFGIFLVSLIVTVSCASPPTTPTTPTPTPTTSTSVRIGFSAWPGWFPWQVAEEAKIFAANQVAVDLKWFDGYLDSINALTVGQLDGNSQTLNDTLSSVAAGSDQVIVLVNDNSTGNDQIIVRQGINAIADLKGKKVAAEEGTVDHFLLLLGLQKAGLAQKDIEFKPLETGAAAAAFAAGQVDAVGVFAPFTTKALERSGSKVLFSSKDFPGAISDHLAVSRKFLQAHPQEVQAMVNSWFATLDFIQKNQPQALEIMAKRAGVTVAEYKDYDAGTHIFSVAENLKAFEPGQDMTALPFAAKQISQFLVSSGLIKQAPDLSNLFDPQFVKAYAAAHPS
ncbi:sulfonate ABC transporter substrate-binding protein [Neosynechococcus sphagnicola sy1]|uniref:Sulfonate ABC transporter substrate-binding protein n=1 Tax=Neosynechococcus sphagnicola sy1 TaxID=1497020 RepID=A0A098TLF9_9CYAN|nr:ABC transporter substrate-binding protein [Neosynechococcus sphagnicola]KGF73150.1 sulfonate ABC transporter substrate-binding protein [Neosynechococcus sphagnicola sy1]